MVVPPLYPYFVLLYFPPRSWSSSSTQSFSTHCAKLQIFHSLLYNMLSSASFKGHLGVPVSGWRSRAAGRVNLRSDCGASELAICLHHPRKSAALNAFHFNRQVDNEWREHDLASSPSKPNPYPCLNYQCHGTSRSAQRYCRYMRHTSSPTKPKRTRQTLSARRIMTTVFWNGKGILLVDFITSAVYCETLKKSRRSIQNKSCCFSA